MRTHSPARAMVTTVLALASAHAAPARAEQAPAAAAPFSHEVVEPEVERYTLDNGLEVLLQPDPRQSHVALCVSYAVGGRDQPAGFRGLAHLTEHLMFQGSRHVAEDQHYVRLERVGAREVNAATSADATSFWEVVPAHQLPTALWLESDRMAYLLDSLDQAVVDQQRAVVLSELHERVGSSPLGRLPRLVQTRLYARGHPYRQIGDDPAHLARIRLPHVQWFFQRWYSPDTARLAIVGGFEPDETRTLVERYFGGIAATHPPRPAKVAPTVEPLRRERRVTFGSAYPRRRIALAWPTPAFLRPGDAELDFAMHLLGQGPLSRLHRRLVSESQMADAVDARQSSHELGSTFTVDVVLTPEAQLRQVLAVVDEEVARLGSSPVSPEELARVGLVIESRRLLAAEDLGGRAHALAAFRSPLARDGVYRLEDDLARYGAVTPRGVAEAVRRFLPVDRRLVVTVLPDPEVGIEGRVLHEELRTPTEEGPR